jgi:hypothetical protein
MFILLSQLPQQGSQGVPQTQGGGQIIDIQGQAANISPIASIANLVEIGASAILTAGTLGALLYLALGAFKWLTAGGEKGKVEEGRNMMTQAIIGLVILASIFVIYQLVLNFLGLGDRFGLGTTGTTGGSAGVGNTAPGGFPTGNVPGRVP